MVTISDNPEINLEEKDYIQQLKGRMKDVTDSEICDDHLFKRFLRARNYDIAQAETMLRKHLNWRQIHKVDTILMDFTPPEAANYIALNHIGYDPEGCPIFYCHFSYIDNRGLLKCVQNKYDIIKFFIHLFEGYVKDMKERSEKLGKTIEQFVYVFNFENYSLLNATHKPTFDVLLLMIQMYDGNYPERLKTCYVINASFAFSVFYAIVKPFVAARTVKKIKFFGADGWKEDLQTIIDKEKVPAFLGGNLRDPDGDPMCRTLFNLGGPVPPSFYNTRRRTSVIKGAKKLIVPRMSKVEVKFDILFPGSMLEWEFQTKSRDIAFEVLYKENNIDHQAPKEIIPGQRMDTEGRIESQVVRCEKAGVYILVFDNSFSWLRQKEIFYRATVTSPHDVDK